MTMYKAFITDKKTGEKRFMDSDSFDSIKEFKRALRENGYSVSKIAETELYDFILNHTNCEKRDWDIVSNLYKNGVSFTDILKVI